MLASDQSPVKVIGARNTACDRDPQFSLQLVLAANLNSIREVLISTSRCHRKGPTHAIGWAKRFQPFISPASDMEEYNRIGSFHTEGWVPARNSSWFTYTSPSGFNQASFASFGFKPWVVSHASGMPSRSVSVGPGGDRDITSTLHGAR